MLDPLLITVDRALRALFATPHAARPMPMPGKPPEEGASATGQPAAAGDAAALSDGERRESAGLMRVNHSGEVAAQALYHGQSALSRKPATQAFLLKAAREEADHLAWCDERLRELGSRPSLLAPLWYAGSFTIGAAAAVLGDRASLGFVSETERQVEGHLTSHLSRLPAADLRSRAIVSAMRDDEVAHGAAARAAGGVELPGPVRALMRATAHVMTFTSYWI